MRIAVAATPEVALPALHWLQTSEHDLVRIISQPDKPSGRGQERHASPVSNWAMANSVDLVRPEIVGEIDAAIADVDLLITIGYGRILPPTTIPIPKFGCINLHFSLLPKYRGAAPVQRAIEAGETQSGVTVFALDAGMDTGPIYTSITTPIEPTMRSFELLDKLSHIGVDALKQALLEIEKGTQPIPQTGESSLAAKITREEARLDWSLPAHSLVNKIRAFYPQPQAWTLFRGQPLKISWARVSDVVPDLQQGELRIFGSDCVIGTLDKAIILERVTPAGKKEMSALDWSRGARFEDAERCG
jgi:methionyl-tRNA formyltransferase